MNFRPAIYFDKLEEEEKEQERLNPPPQLTTMQKIWNMRTAFIG